MLPEYDFSGGERGRYAAQFREGREELLKSAVVLDEQAWIAHSLRTVPANIDMLLSGRDERGGLVMAIEAESFGPLVSRAMSDALERLLSSASSKGLARVRELTSNILGPAEKGQPRLHQIRYQLLTASAAALARAKQERAARAVVMIHEFSTPRKKAKNRSRNSRDLVRFLKRLGMNDPDRVLGGELVGPVSVPGGARFENPAPLYFGKATRQVEIRDRVD